MFQFRVFDQFQNEFLHVCVCMCIFIKIIIRIPTLYFPKSVRDEIVTWGHRTIYLIVVTRPHPYWMVSTVILQQFKF